MSGAATNDHGLTTQPLSCSQAGTGGTTQNDSETHYYNAVGLRSVMRLRTRHGYMGGCPARRWSRHDAQVPASGLA